MKTNPTNKFDSNKQKKTIEIPAEGALGILALGAVGIKAWRKKRAEDGGRITNNSTNE
ncbi:MAG: hypothetical protein IPP64_10870 [Bacteroidetes bacterium]|nr:hypothetical protein [Bacteroidota bacterium]